LPSVHRKSKEPKGGQEHPGRAPVDAQIKPAKLTELTALMQPQIGGFGD
jgi:hypothetical protein